MTHTVNRKVLESVLFLEHSDQVKFHKIFQFVIL